MKTLKLNLLKSRNKKNLEEGKKIKEQIFKLEKMKQQQLQINWKVFAKQ